MVFKCYSNLIILILLIIIFLVVILYNNNINENFSVGYGTGFAQFYKPYPKCDSNNNCFPGYYYRSEIYSNLCEPQQGLLKTKRNLNSNCTRQLNKNNNNNY